MHEVVDDVVQDVVLRLEVEERFVLGKAQRRPTDVEEPPEERVLENVTLQDARVLEEQERLPRLEPNGRSPPHPREQGGRLAVSRISVTSRRQTPVRSFGRREIRVVRSGDQELFALGRVKLVLDGEFAAEEDLDGERSDVDFGELVTLQSGIELTDRARQRGLGRQSREKVVPGRAWQGWGCNELRQFSLTKSSNRTEESLPFSSAASRARLSLAASLPSQWSRFSSALMLAVTGSTRSL